MSATSLQNGAFTTTNERRHNSHARGLFVVIDVTAGDAGFSVVPSIRGVVGSHDYELLAGTAITAVGKTMLQVHPDATAAANAVAKALVPSRTTVKMTHADAKSITYRVYVEDIA
jgi:hypothetical protein